jgi:hypothetical protein
MLAKNPETNPEKTLEKKSKKFSFKKNLNIIKLFGAISLASLSANYANAQTNNSSNENNQSTYNSRFELFGGLNREIYADRNLKKESTLELGALTKNNELGIGFIFTFPRQNYLGSSEQLKRTEGISNNYALVEKTSSKSYFERQSIEGILSFERERLSPFFSLGIQRRTPFELIRKYSHFEYEENGVLKKTETIIGPEHRIEQFSKNYELIGAGAKLELIEGISAYARLSTTIRAPRDNLFISFGANISF